jgi:Phosphotransferase enzyme family
VSERWTEPHWLATVHAWIEGELARLGQKRVGAIEQPHVYPWSTVLRVPTEDGPVWFKANIDALRHEARLTTLLSARRPDCVPPLLAADLERGWMLMADAGTRLRQLQAEERDLGRWLEVLPLYAGVQIDLSADADELLALGVPDARLATLPEGYERLVDEMGAERRFRDAVPYVAELCEELAAYGLPDTIQHDDLHDGQVFVREGRYLLLDWGDACVSHPFCTLSVTLEGVLAWGLDDVENAVDTTPFRDAYLAPWAERYDGDLAAACRLAMRLGWAARAVSAHAAGGDREKTPVRLQMFLDGRVS